MAKRVALTVLILFWAAPAKSCSRAQKPQQRRLGGAIRRSQRGSKSKKRRKIDVWGAKREQMSKNRRGKIGTSDVARRFGAK